MNNRLFHFRDLSKHFEGYLRYKTITSCSNYSIANYVKIPVFHFYENMNNRQLKMVNVNY